MMMPFIHTVPEPYHQDKITKRTHMCCVNNITSVISPSEGDGDRNLPAAIPDNVTRRAPAMTGLASHAERHHWQRFEREQLRLRQARPIRVTATRVFKQRDIRPVSWRHWFGVRQATTPEPTPPAPSDHPCLVPGFPAPLPGRDVRGRGRSTHANRGRGYGGAGRGHRPDGRLSGHLAATLTTPLHGMPVSRMAERRFS